MKNEFSLERLFIASEYLDQVLKAITPVFGNNGHRPDFIVKLCLVKSILDDVYQKEK